MPKEKEFTCDVMNRLCSLYLMEQKVKKGGNEEIFNLLRFALSGKSTGCQVADIAEVIGKK